MVTVALPSMPADPLRVGNRFAREMTSVTSGLQCLLTLIGLATSSSAPRRWPSMPADPLKVGNRAQAEALAFDLTLQCLLTL